MNSVHPHATDKRQQRRRFGLFAFGAAVATFLTACGPADKAETDSATANAYVGAATCAKCHSYETERWRGSHHDKAMEPATPETVLGDFANTQFIHGGVTSRFFARDGAYFVETDGSDGKSGTFPVRFTFGVVPLQQYLVELPDGKLQALGIAWDTRTRDDGGQKWFHVYGDEPVPHTDILHWTQFTQNWETMCADCHSTNLLSRYDVAQDRFSTTWDELDVSCEACHGAGEQHVSWARNNNGADMPPRAGFALAFDERNGVDWQLNEATGNSRRSTPRTTDIEINACAGCHSRRSRIADNNDPAMPFLDNYSPALIDPPLYHADGQMHDEVYVYGSFLQSRMQQAGVTCSDCHDPHSLELRAPGPAVCLQCHAAETFRTAQHQLHADDTANCIDCHMPPVTYMQIDARHDHSLRIPRPDFTVAFGVPNACNNCHTDRDALWAVSALEKVRQPSVTSAAEHWSARLAAATQQAADPTPALLALAQDDAVPGIIRGTAVSRLRVGDAPDVRQLLTDLARAPDPLVRLGVANALENSDPLLAAAVGAPLLEDPLRAVRISAAVALAGADPALLPAQSNVLLQKAVGEYIASQEVNNERPESHVNIANLQLRLGRFDLAEVAYKEALALNPRFVPAYANLADLYREWKRESDAEATLRKGLAAVPEDAYLHHALGLSLVRQNRLTDALPELQIAADAQDATPRFALVYALALDGTGQAQAAASFLEAATRRFGNDPELSGLLLEIRARN